MRGWNNNKNGRMEDETVGGRQKLRDRVIKAVVAVVVVNVCLTIKAASQEIKKYME